MTQPDRIVAHCLWMAQREPSYALKAAKWYSQLLENPDILAKVQAALTNPTPEQQRGNQRQ